MTTPTVGVLYSGGKDSTLAALLLDRFYDVTLVTTHFGITDAWQHAQSAAAELPGSFQAIELDRSIAETAIEIMTDDGYPRNGIQHAHDEALEALADRDFDAIADGTRRDDRAPTVSRAAAQSIEDRYNVDYIAPLSGFGRSAVDDLVSQTLEVTVGPSEDIPRADYEAELRAIIRDEWSDVAITDIFPAHDQTVVTGLK